MSTTTAEIQTPTAPPVPSPKTNGRHRVGRPPGPRRVRAAPAAAATAATTTPPATQTVAKPPTAAAAARMANGDALQTLVSGLIQALPGEGKSLTQGEAQDWLITAASALKMLFKLPAGFTITAMPATA